MLEEVAMFIPQHCSRFKLTLDCVLLQRAGVTITQSSVVLEVLPFHLNLQTREKTEEKKNNDLCTNI